MLMDNELEPISIISCRSDSGIEEVTDGDLEVNVVTEGGRKAVYSWAVNRKKEMPF